MPEWRSRDADMHDDRYAEPAFRDGATPDEDAFVSLDVALDRVRRELGLPDPSAFDVLTARWDEIVGPDVALHARLVSVHDGVATVAADSPPWAGQLRYLEAAIVERVEAVAGPGVVSAVRVRVTR